MYSLLIGSLIFAATPTWAEVARVLKVTGPQDALVSRGKLKIPIKKKSLIIMKDEISSLRSLVILQFYPSTHLSLAPDSKIKFSEQFVVDFNQGIIRLKVKREGKKEVTMKVQAEDVSFSADNSAEFDVSLDAEANVNLDVIQGEVIVSSPYVHTFVPEIVKGNEGFKFDKKQRSFSRRAFKAKLKPGSGR